MNIKHGIFFLALTAALQACYYDNKQDLLANAGGCDTSSVSFSTTINPVIVSACNSCHGGSSPSAGISTEGYSNVKALVDNGQLWGSMNHENGFSAMPQGASKLESCYLQKVKAWINAGAANN